MHHAITSLKINRFDRNFVGLFGYIKGATVRNVGLVDVDIVGDSYVGGLVGFLDNSTISNSYATGIVTGVPWPTGMGWNIGGLVGINLHSVIINSYAICSVTGDEFIGALVGYNNEYSAISNSYATGYVLGLTLVGGLIGVNDDAATVTSSYWDTEISTSGPGIAASEAGSRLTTAQMKQQVNYAGWDFTNIWSIQNGITYPTLRASTNNSQSKRLLLPDGVMYGPSTGAIIVQYQNATAATLLGGIYAGDLQNDRLNPVWRALYINGEPTAAQIEANRLENQYRNATANDLVNELKAGTRKSDGTDPVWNVLPSAKRNEALTLLAWMNRQNDVPVATDPVSTPTPTPAPPQTGQVTTSGGSSPPAVVSIDKFLQVLGNDPSASFEKLDFNGSSFTYNGSQGNISVSAGYVLEKVLGGYVKQVKDGAIQEGITIVAQALLPSLATAIGAISSGVSQKGNVDLFADIAKAAQNMIEAKLSTSAVGSVFSGTNDISVVSTCKTNCTDNVGAYVQFTGTSPLYDDAVAQGLMTRRWAEDAGYRYYATAKGAIAYYVSKVPPKKVDTILGFGGTYTYEGVEQNQKLLNQLVQGVAKS